MKKAITKTELSNLRTYVPTTTTQAQTIKSRNTTLLNFLNSLPTTLEDCKKYIGDIYFKSAYGCPHCEYSFGFGYQCHKCQWQNFPSTKRVKCCDATFGGINLTHMKKYNHVKVEYSIDSEEVTCNFLIYVIEKSHNFPRDFKVYLKQLNNCKKFCQAHIDWAESYL